MSIILMDPVFSKGQIGFDGFQTQTLTMTFRFQNIILVTAAIFYVPMSLGLPLSTMDSLTSLFEDDSDTPICGCKDPSCCCGAPCCAPKTDQEAESSCCSSSKTKKTSRDEAPLSLKLAWKATCTCGQNHGHDGSILVDPHNLVRSSGTSFWLPGLAKDFYYVRNWTSVPPAPPEQVPKALLFS